MRVAIVGGGASGVLAAHALGAAARGLDVVLADPRPGRGLAYGGTQPLHLLNTRACNMSLDEGRPDGFVAWLNRTRPEGRTWSPDDFAPRRVYGDYLEGRLRELAGGGSVRLIDDRVTALARVGGEWALSMQEGRPITTDAVVLATGNPRPRPLSFPGRELLAREVVLDDPWDETAVAAVPGSGEVLLVGTGLTAVDVAVSLLGRPAGPSVVAASRRGLLPRIHDLPRPAVNPIERPFPTTARGLYRRVRDAAQATADGDVYARHAVFLGLRPVIPELWAGLPLPEKQRFMRHLRAWWEVERHRLAPTIAAVIAEGEAGPLPGLYALGPLTRGTFFEITAVPEIRARAARIAQRLAAGEALRAPAASAAVGASRR